MAAQIALVMLAAALHGVAAASDNASELEYWYTNQFRANETHLTGLPSATLVRLLGDTNVEAPCGGVPSIQTRAGAGASTNGNCPELLGTWGASCTCLPAYVAARTTWEFKVRKRSQAPSSDKVRTPEDVLEIDAIETLVVPPELERLCVPYLQFTCGVLRECVVR